MEYNDVRLVGIPTSESGADAKVRLRRLKRWRLGEEDVIERVPQVAGALFTERFSGRWRISGVRATGGRGVGVGVGCGEAWLWDGQRWEGGPT